MAVISTPVSTRAEEDETTDQTDETASGANETVDEARRHFEQAVVLFRDEDLDAALAEFRESYRLNPLPQVLFNIAVTQRDLHRYPDAVETLSRYLEIGATEPSRRLETASELMEELEALIASVNIHCNEEGADLFVDGELTDRTPIDSPLPLAAGRHELEIRLDGHQTWRDSIEVHGGQELAIEVELEPHRRRWYQRWWVWTIVGVVAVGTAAGIVAGVTTQPRGAELDVVLDRGGGP